jgi:hypothetical protein
MAGIVPDDATGIGIGARPIARLVVAALRVLLFRRCDASFVRGGIGIRGAIGPIRVRLASAQLCGRPGGMLAIVPALVVAVAFCARIAAPPSAALANIVAAPFKGSGRFVVAARFR